MIDADLKMGEKNTSAASLLPLPLLRVVSLVLALTMLVGDPGWAASVSDFIHVSFTHDLHDLTVPSKFGTLMDRWIAPRPAPFVVLIQDLHANIGVQNNVAAIIEHLFYRYQISNVFTEAAFGPCEVSLLRSSPTRRAQNKLVDKLLSQALINGADLAAIRAGKGRLSPIDLSGVDDPWLYLANVQAFRDLLRVGPAAAREWKALRDLLMPGSSPQLRRHLELTEKLLGLTLLDSDWLQYKEHRNLTPRGSPTLMTAITAAERFYTAAEARNNVLAENLLSSLHAPRAILFTGGFHTASIAHTLKTRGISFVVISPKVDRFDQDALYIQSMTEPPHETVMALSTNNPLGLKEVVADADETSDNQTRGWAWPRLRGKNNVAVGMNGRPKSDQGNWILRLLAKAGVAGATMGTAVAKTAPLAGTKVVISHAATQTTFEISHTVVVEAGKGPWSYFGADWSSYVKPGTMLHPGDIIQWGFNGKELPLSRSIIPAPCSCPCRRSTRRSPAMCSMRSTPRCSMSNNGCTTPRACSSRPPWFWLLSADWFCCAAALRRPRRHRHSPRSLAGNPWVPGQRPPGMTLMWE